MNRVAQDDYLWRVFRRLYCLHDGDRTAAQRDVAPLEWYLMTGRADPAFLLALSLKKPGWIARKLLGKGFQDYALTLADIRAYVAPET